MARLTWVSRVSVPGHRFMCAQSTHPSGYLYLEVQCSCGWEFSQAATPDDAILLATEAIGTHLEAVGE
jgi:hypothetical protein